MKVLIVDDDLEKVRVVSQELSKVEGCDSSDIDSASNARDAKVALQSTQYDLMILDIVLPERIDLSPSANGGIELLKEVLSRTKYKKPEMIVGLSAYEEGIATAEPVFEQDLWHVLRYSATSTEWREQLKRKVQYLSLRKSNPEAIAFKKDVVVVCALQEPELSAVLRLSWEWTTTVLLSDPSTNYSEGVFQNRGDRRSIVAVAAPRMGLVSAAITATKALYEFRPRYLFMTGITAGFTGRCNLGDLLVGDPCWNYESGKWAASETGSVFEPAPHQLSLAGSVRAALQRTAQNSALLSSIRDGWHGTKPDTNVKVLFGPLASGAAVRADSNARSFVREQHRQANGLEMEAYAVMAAAAEGILPESKAAVIKSVCDFADSAKADSFQPYAAYVSAQVLKHLLESELDFSGF